MPIKFKNVIGVRFMNIILELIILIRTKVDNQPIPVRYAHRSQAYGLDFNPSTITWHTQ